MKAYGVDPRYVAGEVSTPIYRVDFWTPARVSEEWRLEDASDVTEVFAWAEQHSDGRDYVVWVEYRSGESAALLRLVGWEPR